MMTIVNFVDVMLNVADQHPVAALAAVIVIAVLSGVMIEKVVVVEG